MMIKTFPKAIEKRRIQVISFGGMALSCLFRTTKWQVIATFKRSFYCRDNKGNIICIAQEEIGQGPFTLLCSTDSSWPGSMLSTTSSLRVRKNQLLLEGDGLIFDLHGASVWRKSLSALSSTGEKLLSDITWLARKAVCESPPESLGRVVSEILPLNVHKLRRQSCTLTEALHQRFIEVISGVRHLPILFPGEQLNSSMAEELSRLIGLGPGLTPSGDDFLAGIVMGLFKMEKQDEAASLAHYFYRSARGRVSEISLAFYRALAEGLVAEPYYQLLEAVGRGDSGELDSLVKRVGHLGGTSGWDSIAGIIFGISLALADTNETGSSTSEAVC
jgi:hypothetical protein